MWAMLAIVLTMLVTVGSDTALAQAGVRWQSPEIGGCGITVLNPHWGFAGPKVGNTVHTNLTAYCRPGGVYTPKLNLHASRYNGRCFYGWDSVRNWVIYDFCFPSWGQFAGAAAAAAAIAVAVVRTGGPYILIPAA